MRDKQLVMIFDGPDGCGKTNIAQALSTAIGVPYFKNSDEHKYFRSDPNYFVNAIRYVDTYFTSYLEKTGASVILDRAWPSEWIYSKVLRRNTDYEVLRDLDIRHANLNTIIVIPYRSSYDNVEEQYDEIRQRLQDIDTKYREFAEWSQCHTLLMNVDSEDLQDQLRIIVNFMQDVNNSDDKLYYII